MDLFANWQNYRHLPARKLYSAIAQTFYEQKTKRLALEICLEFKMKHLSVGFHKGGLCLRLIWLPKKNSSSGDDATWSLIGVMIWKDGDGFCYRSGSFHTPQE